MQEFRIRFFEDTRSYLDKIHKEIIEDKRFSDNPNDMTIFTELFLIGLKALCEPMMIILVCILLVEQGLGAYFSISILPLLLVSLARELDPSAKPDTFPRFLVVLAMFLAAFSLPMVLILSLPFIIEQKINSSLAALILMAAVVWLFISYRPKK